LVRCQEAAKHRLTVARCPDGAHIVERARLAHSEQALTYRCLAIVIGCVPVISLQISERQDVEYSQLRIGCRFEALRGPSRWVVWQARARQPGIRPCIIGRGVLGGRGEGLAWHEGHAHQLVLKDVPADGGRQSEHDEPCYEVQKAPRQTCSPMLQCNTNRVGWQLRSEQSCSRRHATTALEACAPRC